MSEMYAGAGAVLFNDWYASRYISNLVRAATESQCKSISPLSHVCVDADRRQDMRLRSKVGVVVR